MNNWMHSVWRTTTRAGPRLLMSMSQPPCAAQGMKGTHLTQSWPFLPQKSDQDPAKAHMTHFSWRSCCFMHSDPLCWQQQQPGWFPGLCQSPFCHPYCCLLCLCLALPSTEISLIQKERKIPKSSLSVSSTCYFHLTRNYLSLNNLACKVETKLWAVCVSSHLEFNSDWNLLHYVKRKKNHSAQIAKVTINCFSLVNEVGMYMLTDLLHSKGTELVLCFIWMVKVL